jgi:hypothetical protein
MSTIDPSQIASAAGIPPQGAGLAGLSTGLVEVYSGTLAGDTDAQPAAKELLGTALDTGTDSNADYIYKQVSKLYGGVELPLFQSPAGNNVKALVFVSGSAQGGYGAFHFPGTQAEFDRIVVDSLNVSGSYSAGSGLGSALAPLKGKAPRLFPMFRGADDLLGVIHADDSRLKGAKPDAIRLALAFGAQSTAALATALETRNVSAIPQRIPAHAAAHAAYGGPKAEGAELIRRLVLANQAIIGLVEAAARASAGRQHLSTALFAAEIIESFEMLTGKADAGKTDGEAVSRVVAFKLAPEIALIPGFNSGVAQQWWKDGHPDFVNVNSENDQSTDGNGAGVMFLEFLTDYLGVPMDQILKSMPATGGAPLGQTYVALLNDHPELGLAQVAGPNGTTAFQKMISLLQQNTQSPDGSLNLPANGNPFPNMPGAKQGGLFAAGAATPASTGAVAQDLQAALQLETQIEQQVAALKAALGQIRGDLTGVPAPSVARAKARPALVAAEAKAKDSAFAYKPPLAGSVATNLEQRVASFRAPQYDQTLQTEFWPHVYNELPGSGTNKDRLQVITGTNQTPAAVQITGTLLKTPNPEADGDLHISFQPDDPSFPTNQNKAEPPLEIEIIYAGAVTQADAQKAETGYKNPFDISKLASGTRIQAAGPLIYDRAHGIVDSSGNVLYGLEIHPLTGMTVLSGGRIPPPPPPPLPPPPPQPSPAPPPPPDPTQLSSDLESALGQVGTLGQTLGTLTSLIQKMKGEGPAS